MTKVKPLTIRSNPESKSIATTTVTVDTIYVAVSPSIKNFILPVRTTVMETSGRIYRLESICQKRRT